MTGNIPLILCLTMGTCLIAGAAMLSEWRKFRDPAAGWWCAAFLSSAAGASVFPLRGILAFDFLSIGLSNAAFLASYSAVGAGIAAFAGRRPSLALVLFPSLCWLVFWFTSPLAADFDTRVVVMSAATATISAISARLAFSPRIDRLGRVLAVVMSLRAAFFLGRLIWSVGALGPVSDAARGVGFQIVIMEGLWTSVLVGYLMLALLREKRETSLIRLAETDFLTGADNRRAFQLKAERALARAGPHRTAALMMLDLDNFKQVNDIFGHSFGDEVLRRFAAIVRARLAPGDIFARLGGEEFSVVIADGDPAGAWRLAEAIRLDFERAMLDLDLGPVSATVSIGLTTTQEPERLEALLFRADEALYRAKTSGRNRVEDAALREAEAETPPILPRGMGLPV
ncbi:GGDEF domain-containing protein [Jiella sonneratiae]|uniref:diguanylate cyclase n=1 Tax=Jiella sonneratiae TaxID=2816856 RepID=A0ABS3J430_9HYPH|nr:GGDEF domain-containing protein [Jiella sonneratiae]MBO0904422.1 GGDEF domain-containing protein [Jiella sonneratiae]